MRYRNLVSTPSFSLVIKIVFTFVFKPCLHLRLKSLFLSGMVALIFFNIRSMCKQHNGNVLTLLRW